MARLPQVSGDEIIKYLSNKKDFHVSRTKGSHVILKSKDNIKTVPVPRHENLDRGTLSHILWLASIDTDEFIDEWNN